MKYILRRKIFKFLVSPVTAAALFIICLHGSMCGINAIELDCHEASQISHSDATCHCECHTAGNCSIISPVSVTVQAKSQFSEIAPLPPAGMVNFHSANRLSPLAPPGPPSVSVIAHLRI